MSRIRLAADAGLAAVLRAGAADAYGAHRLIWTLFGDKAERRRDFLYRQTGHGRDLAFLTVSARPPEDRHGVFAIETRDYAPTFARGRRLRFELRANPVVARVREGGRGARHDVMTDAVLRSEQRGLDAHAKARLRTEAALAWLERRGCERAGFALDAETVRVDPPVRHRFVVGKREAAVVGVDFDGELTVTDPEAFVGVLHAGLGAARGFGFGLLLVRRA